MVKRAARERRVHEMGPLRSDGEYWGGNVVLVRWECETTRAKGHAKIQKAQRLAERTPSVNNISYLIVGGLE